MQATLLKAWEKRDSYRSGSNLRAWLFTILRNTFLSELRKFRREVEDADGAKANALSEEPRQDHALELKEVISAIALLPYDQRRSLVLTGAYGYSQLEVADACGCPVGTVKSRVSRARAVLDHAFVGKSAGQCRPSPPLQDRPAPARHPRVAAQATVLAAHPYGK